jgi:hypothetical protein
VSAACRFRARKLFVRNMSNSKGFVLMINRETYTVWERRAPLCSRPGWGVPVKWFTENDNCSALQQ